MKQLLPFHKIRRTALLLIFLLSIGFAIQSIGQTQQLAPTIQLENVSGKLAEYTIRLTKPEVPIQNIVNAFIAKQGIISCAVKGANVLTVISETDITPDLLLAVIRNQGCINTIKAYRAEEQSRQPKKEQKTESK